LNPFGIKPYERCPLSLDEITILAQLPIALTVI
jgi:hypothetical protein